MESKVKDRQMQTVYSGHSPEYVPSKQPVKISSTKLQYTCPQCGASVDTTTGRCSGCGLLLGIGQQAMLKPVTDTEPDRSPSPIRMKPVAPLKPAEVTGQQFPPPYGTRAQYPQRTCPDCGSVIDDSGTCLGCGLLFGSKHQTMTGQTAVAAQSPMSYVTPAEPLAFMGAQSPQSLCPDCGSIIDDSGTCLGCGLRFGSKHQVMMGKPAVAAAGAGGAGGMAISLPQTAAVPPVDRGTRYKEAEWKAPRPSRGFPMGTLLLILLLIVVFAVGGYYVFAQDLIHLPTSPPAPSPTVDTTPPKIQSVSLSSITDTSAIVTWTTNEPATSKVTLCDPGGTCTWVEGESLATNHSITLNDLEPDTAYHLTLLSEDESGNEKESEKELTTLGEPDTIAPEISGIEAISITESGATIEWITDEEATSQVEYGTTDTYGSSTSLDEEMTTNHTVILADLDSDTIYHFSVKSKDASGNEAASTADQTFQTLEPTPQAEEGIKVGDLAPDFTLQDLDEEHITLSDLRGKIVMVNFWATWCGPCLSEMPYIEAVRNNWSEDDLVILAVNWKDDFGDVQSFITSEGYTFTVLLDADGDVDTLYEVSSFPQTFFIGTDGIIKVKQQETSFHSQSEIENILDTL